MACHNEETRWLHVVLQLIQWPSDRFIQLVSELQKKDVGRPGQ